MTAQLDKVKETVKKFENAFPKGVEKTPETIQEIVKSNDALLEDYLENLVDSKMKFDGVAKIVKRQAITEMADQFKTKDLVDKTVNGILESVEIKTIVQEMEQNNDINPAVDNRAKNTNKYISK